MTRKKLVVGAVAAAGALVLAGTALRPLLDLNRMRPEIEQTLTTALGRQVSIGAIRLAPLSRGVAIDGFKIADDLAFGSAPFIEAKVIVRLDLWALLTSRSVQVESLRLQEPRIALVRATDGSWNVAALVALAASPTLEGMDDKSLLPRKVAITHGRVMVGGTAARRTFEDVNAELESSNASGVSFQVSAALPETGSVHVDGEAHFSDNAATTPFRANVRVAHLDVQSNPLVEPGSGARGIIDLSGTFVSDGRVISSNGTSRVTGAQLAPEGSPAASPIEIVYRWDYEPASQRMTVKETRIRVGSAEASLVGTGSFSAVGEVVQLSLSGAQMPLTSLVTIAPALGLPLPAGSSLRDGFLDADFAISGPLHRLVIVGPIRVSKAVIDGFDLGARLGSMASFAGLAKNSTTTVEELGAMIHASDDGIQVHQLNLVVPTIGRMTGAGAIISGGVLDFAMLAQPLGRGAAGFVTGEVVTLTSLGKGIPFRIRGTTVNPDFGPDMGRAFSNVVRSPEAATKAAGGRLNGLLHRKRQ